MSCRLGNASALSFLQASLLAAALLGAPGAPAEDSFSVVSTAPNLGAAATGPAEKSADDAWWTGPLLASTAATLPQGHLYVEPYLYDNLPYARFDRTGHSHTVPHADDFGSQTYINYGLTDLLTVGLIPRFGYDLMDGGQSSAHIGIADPSVQVQYRLTQFQPGSSVPTISINLQESLPIGRYDRLSRPSDGFGSGAWTTSLGAYLQSLFWMPNGRILRLRADFSYSVSGSVPVDDESVYGTPVGFRGRAGPGDSAYADLAFEYSVTRHWVLACDFWLERDGNTRVRGQLSSGSGPTFDASSGASRELMLAPALEYNWNARIGIIVGARIITAARNVTAVVTPVAAFSYFL